MNKEDLISQLSAESGVSKKDVSKILNCLPGIIMNEIRTKGFFKLLDVCRINLRWCKSKEGRNPSTGEKIHIPGYMTLKLKITQKSKTSLNESSHQIENLKAIIAKRGAHS